MTEDKSDVPGSMPAPQPNATEAGAAVAPPSAQPHPDAARRAEEAALKATSEINAKALPVRQYLEHSVVPVVFQGECFGNMPDTISTNFVLFPNNPHEWPNTC
jgi:hypothetical protein